MSNSVKFIFGFPDRVDGVGYVYPIKMKHYDEFMDSANILCLSYDHFNLEEIKEHFQGREVKLFDLLILMGSESQEGEGSFLNLGNIFSYILRKQVVFDDDSISFVTEDGNYINRENYDQLREVIMKQNLLFTPKVYKNKRLQEWADKVLKTRAKNGLDSSIEDMVSTIAVISSKNYEQLAEYTIYQIRSEFNRIMKIESYRNAILFKSQGAEKVDLQHYAEKMDMFKSPYDDIFKEKSSMKNLNAAVQGD